MAETPHAHRPRTLQCLLFAAGILVGLAASELSRPPRAHAQIPDAAAQRHQVARAAQETNALLRQMLDHLKGGTLKVKVVEEDKGSKTAPARPPSRKR